MVGGVAAVLHGSSRVTIDLDICISFDDANLQRLVRVLAPYEPMHASRPELSVRDEAPERLRRFHSFLIKTSLGRPDVLRCADWSTSTLHRSLLDPPSLSASAGASILLLGARIQAPECSKRHRGGVTSARRRHATSNKWSTVERRAQRGLGVDRSDVTNRDRKGWRNDE